MKELRPGSKLARVWQALCRARGLTSMEAFSLGVCQLPAIVFKLRRMGYRVVGQWETSRTRFGERARYLRYRATLNQNKRNAP